MIKLHKTHYLLRDVFKNKWRFFLSVMGISIALLIFITGNLMADSYYFALFSSIEHYKSNNLKHIHYISKENNNDEGNNDLEKLIRFAQKYVGKDYLIFQKKYLATFTMPLKNENNVELNISLDLIATNENFDGSIKIDTDMCQPTKLREGRGITNTDIINGESVIVIDSLLSELLFDGDAINKTLNVPIRELIESPSGELENKIIEYHNFKIVGVYENSAQERKNLYTELKNVSDKHEQHIYTAKCYYPNTCKLIDKTPSTIDIIYIGKKDDTGIKSFVSNCLGENISCDIITYHTLAQLIENNMHSTKRLINIGTIVLIFISIVIITQTMLFSIKDDLSEYGIKMAIGASDVYISISLISELLILGIISYILSFILGVTISLITLNYMSHEILYLTFRLIVKPENILLSFLMACLTSLIASIIPLIFIKRKSIVDIIKFE